MYINSFTAVSWRFCVDNITSLVDIKVWVLFPLGRTGADDVIHLLCFMVSIIHVILGEFDIDSDLPAQTHF